MSWMSSKGRSLFRLVTSLALAVEFANARSISVTKACYSFNEPITINFDNTGSPGPTPDFGDWIGLVDPRTLNVAAVSAQPIMWMWACGDQFCADAVSGGTAVFGPNQPDETGLDAWPLNAGNYVAVLTGGTVPYQARALSINFRVMPAGQACPGEQGAGDTGNNQNQNTGNNQNSNNNQNNNNNSGSSGVKVLSGMERFVEDAKADIRTVINLDRRLAPKFLRLAFHDCVGGCDGCVDMTNPDNGGLDFAIGSLDAVVQKYGSRGLSRADIWMLSAIVAAELLQPQNQAIEWPFQWVGRKTCGELNNFNCGTKNGQSMTCDQRRGPDRHLPHSDIGTGTILDFFNKEFGWNARQTAAIMGAHSVGSLRRFNAGFDGEGGWDLTNNSLDNGYFIELVGQSGNPNDIPDFRQVVVQNNDLNSMPSRMQFEANVGGRKVVMLTADIALARQLDEGSNIRSDGAVLCNFRGFNNRCPDARATIGHVTQYARNSGVFLNDFRDVMTLMIEHGYRRTGTCPRGSICELEVN